MTDLTQPTTGGSVLRGGSWYLTSRVVPQLYTFVTSVVAARFLGADGMGRQSFIAFVALSVTMLLSSSMWVSLVRYIGEATGRGEAGVVRGLVSWAWRVGVGVALVGGLAIGVVALAGAEPRSAWLLAAAITTASILHTIPSAILTGLQQFRQASVLGLATGSIGTAATVAVLNAGGGIVGMFAVELAIGTINLIFTAALARRVLVRAAPSPLPAGPLRRQVTRYALLYSTGIVLDLIVARRSELFFLDRFSTDDQIAFYSIAFAIVIAAAQIPGALAAVTAPAFATLLGAGANERIGRGFNRGLRLLLLLALPLTALGLALGPGFVEAVYGEEYRAVSGPLLILLAGYPLFALTSLADALLTGLGRLRFAIGANGLAAGADVALAATLTGPLGARGAALANLAGQALYSAAVLGYTLRIVGRERFDWAVARNAIVSAVAGGAAWTIQQRVAGAPGLVLAAAGFLVAFLALAPVLKVIPRQDADWLLAAIGPKLPTWLTRFAGMCAGGAALSPK